MADTRSSDKIKFTHLMTYVGAVLEVNVVLLLRSVSSYNRRMRNMINLVSETSHRSTKKSRRKQNRRRFWERPGRVSTWWENFVNDVVVPEEWRENFRMTKETFTSLCDELRAALQKEDTTMRREITVEMQVALTLYLLADEGCYRKIATAFGISRSSVSIIVRKVTTAISTLLGPKYIKLPFEEGEVNNLTLNFLSEHGFPQCIRAVDGTHIDIKQPTENYTHYLNRKGK